MDQEPKFPGELISQHEFVLRSARYNLGLAREKSDMCGEFAAMVKMTVAVSPLTFEELGVAVEELDELIALGQERQERKIAMLKAARPRATEEDAS